MGWSRGFEMVYLHLQHGFLPVETGGRRGRLQAAGWRGEVRGEGEMERRGGLLIGVRKEMERSLNGVY